MVRTINEILQILHAHKSEYAERYGVKRLGVFGSVARGEQGDNSDVDICYESDRIPTLLALDRLQCELETLMERPVDLVRIRERMNPRLKARILKEAIYVCCQ